MTDRESEGEDASDWLASQFDPTGELPKQKPDPAAASAEPPVQPEPAAPVQPAAPAAPQQPTPQQPAPQQPAPQQPLPPQPPLQPRTPLPPQAPLQPQAPPAPAPPAPVPPAPVPPAPVPPAPAAPVSPPATPPSYAPAPSPAPQGSPPSGDPAATPPRPQFPPQQPVAPGPATPPAQPPVPPAPVQPVAPPQPASPAQPVQPAQPASPAPPAQPFPPAPPTTPPTPTPAAADPAGGFSWGLSPGGTPSTPAPPATPVPPPTPVPPTPVPPATAVPPATPVPPAAPPADAAPPAPVAPPGPFYRPVAHEPAPLDPAIDGGPSVDAEPPASAMPFETTVLPDVAPDSADAPPFWEPEPTQMMDAVDLEQDPLPRVPQPVPTSVFPPQTRATEAVEAPEADTPPPGSETGQVSAIDALFGETQFREYTEGLDQSQNPFVRQAEAAAGRGPIDPSDPAGPPGPPPGVSRVQRILLSVLGGILALLAIVALFFLGVRLPDLLGPAPAVVVPTGSPSPSASPEIVLGPVEPGEYAWDELLGGECLDPFQDAWQTTYVVVDCADPHPAQMVHRGELPEDATDPTLYPGEDVLQTNALGLCRGPGIFDPAIVSTLTDAVVQASYPTEEVWGEGGRDYFCFVTRSTGEPITGDLALPQVAPVAPAP